MTKGGLSFPECRFTFEPEACDPLVLFVEIKQHGKWSRVAKRYSGQNWIALEPGYTVRGIEPGASKCILEIEHDGTRKKFVRKKTSQ
jgi:hypothetical protein